MSKASQLRQKAQNNLKKGKIPDAIEAYKKLLQVESHNPNLYNELGDIYLRAEDRMQAVLSFDKAVKNYEKVALYNNAVAVCKKILRVVPNRLESIFKLGELKAKQKYTSEASKMFIQYLELASSGEGAQAGENILPNVEAILEFVPEDEELHVRAADVLTQIGFKISAAEIYARLIGQSASSGDGEKTDLYKGRLDLLRGALTADEQARVEEILAGSLELVGDGALDNEPDMTVEDIDTEAVTEQAGSGPAVKAEEEEEEEETPPTPEVEEEAAAEKESAEYEIPVESESESSQEYEISIEAEAESVEEPETPASPAEKPVQEVADVPDAAGEPPVDGATADDSVAEPESGATPSDGDFTNIPDVSANEEAVVDTDQLVEEITSDVEENDFKSHYDLGMAYIEMALYKEAVKELQISARSEQLQLRSLEMIGHCFLQIENPRLAVKQLNRGLEIAMSTGGDNLGIHYNLGLAYEALDDVDKAREHFEEVYIVDVTFRDISEKMKKYSTVS